MEITILGSGPTKIVEGKGKNRRTNSSVLIKHRGKNLLIDVSPYFLEQAEANKIDRIDFVLFTHGHNDCTGGIPDLQKWCKLHNIDKPIMTYLEPETEKRIKEDFKDVSHLAFSYFKPGKTTTLDGIKIIPIRVGHSIQSGYPTVSLRIDNELVYAEDVGSIPKESLKEFNDVDILILDAAMWFDRQIKGHQNVQTALDIVKSLKVKKTILTQAGHTYPAYEEARKSIRDYWDENRGDSKTEVDLSYDGMNINTEKLESMEFIETMKDTKEGIYLPAPHAELIWRGKKKFIVKAKRYPRMVGKLLYYIDKNYAYGILRLKSPLSIGLKQFDEFRKSHCITEEERLAWWRGKEFLFMYPFDVIENFKEPKRVQLPKGTQTFTTDIVFLNQIYELIKNVSDYDPSKPSNEQLADDWRIVCAWYSSKKQGKKIPFSIESIINLAKIIYNEIVKRVKEGRMKHEFKPETMQPESAELYKIVSKGEVIHSNMAQVTESMEKIKPLIDKFGDSKIIIKDFISLVGSSIKHDEGHKPKDIDLQVRMKEPTDYIRRAVEVRLIKDFGNEWEKLHFVWDDPEGSHDTFVPLFDLVLQRREPEIVQMMELTDITAMLKEVQLMKPFLPLKSTSEYNKTLFYDFDKLLQEVKPNQLQPLIVEEKFDGFRGVIHKKGREIKIFSDQGRDVTKAFPTLAKQAEEMTKENIILDGEIVPYDEDGKALGRRELMKYIGAIESGKKLDDSKIKYHIFDCIYFKDKPVVDLKLYERKKILETLRWSNNLVKVPFVTVKDSEQLKKAVKLMRSLPRSEGAMIKGYDSLYMSGKTPNWIKYRVVVDVHVKVLGILPVKGAKAWRYKCGIEIPEKQVGKFLSKYIEEFEGKKYFVFGNTFNTGIEAKEGDTIDVLVQEIWRHENKEGKIRFSWHKPDVRQPSERKETSTIEDLNSIVDARGFLVKEWETVMSDFPDLQLQNDEEGGEVKLRNFPERMQNNFKQVIGKWYPFVMQWHFRGRSVHTDLRHLVPSGYLEGFTLFTPGSIDKPDALTNSGKNIRGTLKLIQPAAWLKFQGITSRVGATKEYPGVFVIVAKGRYTIHEIDDHKIVLEYKSDSGKINKASLKKAESKGLPIKDPGENLRQFDGKFSYHIAHIRPTEWIILFDRVK